MGAMVCDICGGALEILAGGERARCAACGTLCSSERYQEKVLEIRGVVKVEGAANADTMTKRAFILLEDGDFKNARDLLDRVLEADAENAQAYIR